MKNNVTVGALAAVVVAALLVPGIAAGATQPRTTTSTIKACSLKKNGQLRVATKCAKTESALSWKVKGVAGVRRTRRTRRRPGSCRC
jgi:hypothetical protein